MRLVFPNIFKAILLAAAVGLASACENTANSQKGPVYEPLEPGATKPEPSSSGKASDYPKIASSVATAEIKDLEGAKYTLKDRQGKIVLLNLWATWCGPCRAEIPALVRMQELHGPKGFEVIGLNTDDEPVDMINEFGAGLGVNYPMAYADTSLQSSLLKISKFPGIPQSFLIDREGRLRGVFRGANPADIAKMEQVVARVVNEDAGALNEPAPPAAEPGPVTAPADNPSGANSNKPIAK